MEVAAFHPLSCERKRLVSVALFLTFIAALTATYSVRALPGILLCGARTFLSPHLFAQMRAATVRLASDCEFYAQSVRDGTSLGGEWRSEVRNGNLPSRLRNGDPFNARSGQAIRHRNVSPAHRGTMTSVPNGYSAGTFHDSFRSVTVSTFLGRR